MNDLYKDIFHVCLNYVFSRVNGGGSINTEYNPKKSGLVFNCMDNSSLLGAIIVEEGKTKVVRGSDPEFVAYATQGVHGLSK